MGRTGFIGWAVTAVMGIAGACAVAQDGGPILKPKAKAASATVLVVCDLACNWTLDYEAKGALAEGGSKKIAVSLGQHVVGATTEDGADKTELEVDLKSTAQTIVRMGLRAVRDARLQGDQAARDRDAQQARDQAAQREQPASQYAQGQALYGQQRYAEARSLFEAACNGGYMDSCTQLGWLYQNGQGVAIDYATARVFYEKACDGGSMAGCNNLGILYYSGQGVSRDYVLAGPLFQKACNGGVSVACDSLRNVQQAVQQAAAAGQRQAQEAYAAQQRQQQAAEQQSTMEPLVPNVGDKIPGTQWTFRSFGLSEAEGGNATNSTVPEFGINSRYIDWSINLTAEKNSAATVDATCRYYNSAGVAYSGDMQSQVTLDTNNKGAYSFLGGWGSQLGNSWAVGTYQIRCDIGGSTFLRENFDVVSDPVFFLTSQKGVHNAALLIITDAQLVYTWRWYAGALRVSSSGVDFKDTQGKASFQATCAELTVTAAKDNLKITHGGKTETLSGSTQQDATRALQAINSACGK